MPNYTKPDDPTHQDKPEDWLNSALAFSGALGLILKENEGVIVDVKGDMDFGEGVEKIIIFNKDNMIHVTDADNDPNLKEGTLVWMHDYSEN